MGGMFGSNGPGEHSHASFEAMRGVPHHASLLLTMITPQLLRHTDRMPRTCGSAPVRRQTGSWGSD
jgi:hypothetical protein